MHGHSFAIELTIVGPLREPEGWVMDFAEIDAILEPVREELDHQVLNDVAGLENPTSEEIARWVWRRASPQFPADVRLARVSVAETCRSVASFRAS
jgi:6-pyruvoyltetrahydropterin/6-carboxytetrahydropterin synthase